MPEGSTFNVVAYKRLEKWNNYLNIVSVILIFLALSTIPITFFSLRASRDGEVSTVVSTRQLTNITIFGYLSGLGYIEENGEVTIPSGPPKTIPIFFEVDFGSSPVDNTSLLAEPRPDSIVLQVPTNLPFFNDNVQRGVSWLITVATKEVFRQRKEEEPETPLICDQGTTKRERRLRYTYNETLRVLFWCIEIDSFETPFLLYLSTPYRRWILQSGLAVVMNFENFDRDSKDPFAAAAYCNSLVCIPSFDIRFEKKIDRPVEFSYVTSSLQTNRPVPTGRNFSDFEDLIYTPITVLYSTEGVVSTPPTIRSTFFEEVDRYSVGDTVIDSFAISAIIVSSILLFVTLAKLVLFILFNPQSR